jgi:uncharacterized membrane protein HdeD (DUF308 family)
MMNIDELVNYLLAPVGQVALIIGIGQLAKGLGLNSKWIPLLDVVLGLIGGLVVYGYEFNYGLIKGFMIGLAMGLSACGLFSGIKNLVEKAKGEE